MTKILTHHFKLRLYNILKIFGELRNKEKHPLRKAHRKNDTKILTSREDVLKI